MSIARIHWKFAVYILQQAISRWPSAAIRGTASRYCDILIVRGCSAHAAALACHLLSGKCVWKF
jgi:hypothetical protein